MRIKPKDELLVFWLVALVVGSPTSAVLCLVLHWWVVGVVVAYGLLIFATGLAFYRQDRRYRQ